MLDVDTKYTTKLGRPVIDDRLYDKTDNDGAQNKLKYKMEIIWFNVVTLSMIHIMGLYGLYLAVTSTKLLSVIFCEYLNFNVVKSINSAQIAFFITMKRYAMNLNFMWLVNSAAHMWGYKPYEKNMNPTENMGVSLVAYGEGSHNYHHVYPWDYKAAELPYKVNPSTAFIDFFAWLGLAYDLKYATEDMVKKHAEKNGDGYWIHAD